jgi:hypothetical protein
LFVAPSKAENFQLKFMLHCQSAGVLCPFVARPSSIIAQHFEANEIRKKNLSAKPKKAQICNFDSLEIF